MKQLLTFFIASVWLVNGLYCKVLNFVPRHQEIVANILGAEYAPYLTPLIGLSEIVMAVWILTGYHSRLNTWLQITVVLIMNILESLLVPDLLLWGKLNFVFALVFIALVYFNEYFVRKKQ